MLEKIFSLQSGQGYGLSFSKLDFWLFFLLVMMIFSLLEKKKTMRIVFLTFISIFFYYKTSGASVLILLGSISFNYFAAKINFKWTKPMARKSLLVFSVTLNLLVLAYFKYAFFFTESFNAMFHTDFQALNYLAHWTSGITGEGSIMDKIIVPAGVSFFTFQSISYLVDTYKKEVEPVHQFHEYAFFITFFPHVLLGPIARAKDFLPQINQPFQLSKDEFSWAVIQIVKGLVKKIVFADYIAGHFVDKVIDSPTTYPGFVGILAMWAYSLQIYSDFSGYTDMATGIARLMGFKLYQNFNSPYKAINVADFWRRWHRSLGAWLKNYLYIPLGGNKTGGWGTYISTLIIFLFLIFITQWYGLIYIYVGITVFFVVGVLIFPGFKRYVHRDLNLLITLVVGGLWHGPTASFVVWGAMNGVALILYNHWKKISPYENSKHIAATVWKVFITFNFITFTRIWFVLQKEDAPIQFLKHIWNDFSLDFATFGKVFETFQSVFIITIIGMLLHWLPNKYKNQINNQFFKLNFVLQAVAVASIIFVMYQAISDESRGFVYFSF